MVSKSKSSNKEAKQQVQSLDRGIEEELDFLPLKPHKEARQLDEIVKTLDQPVLLNPGQGGSSEDSVLGGEEDCVQERVTGQTTRTTAGQHPFHLPTTTARRPESEE